MVNYQVLLFRYSRFEYLLNVGEKFFLLAHSLLVAILCRGAALYRASVSRLVEPPV